MPIIYQKRHIAVSSDTRPQIRVFWGVLGKIKKEAPRPTSNKEFPEGWQWYRAKKVKHQKEQAMVLVQKLWALLDTFLYITDSYFCGAIKL